MNNQFRSGFVSLIGRPNAGKSTLLNNLVGHKVAITSDKPQTTRNKIMGIVTGENWQLVLLDTPGIHKPHDMLGQNMVKTAIGTLREVDLVYYLVDVTVPIGAGESFIIDKLSNVETPIFLLLNKIDRLDKKELLPLIADLSKRGSWQEVIPISALEGENIDSLIELTQGYLSPGPRYFPVDAITDQPERQLIAELIREKAIRATQQEVPHSIAVELETVEKRTEDLLYLGAVIYVERESQKGIIIGKRGAMLRQIGSFARVDIERLLGSKVYLELWVKVKADWRNKEKYIKEFGYGDLR